MKITEDTLKSMKSLRKKGYTYRQICEEVGVSNWACIQYLRNIEIDKSAIELSWKKAEEEAKIVLTRKGFNHIVNLNDICPSPYWDYYAEKEDKKYLIDVTINQNKNLVDKALRTIDGYNHLILLKQEDNEWRFLEVRLREIF